MIFYRKIKKFQALSFDLDDTLYDNHSHMPVAEAAFLQELHKQFAATQTLTASTWQAHKHEVLANNPLLKNDMGELRRQVLARVFTALGFQGRSLQQAIDFSFDCFYFHRSNFSVNENIHSLLKKLAQRYPLVALTNGNVNLQQIGLAPYFTQVFKASLSLPMKPHQAMFNACKAALNLDAEQILHVGDNLHNDVYGALRAGMQSAWYAYDRGMHIKKEPSFLLPNIQLHTLEELLQLEPINHG